VNNDYPVNPIPPVIIGLCVIIALIEVTFSMASAGLIGGQLGVGWRNQAILQDYSFTPYVWDQVVQQGDYSFDVLKRFVTYAFIHGSSTQAIFGVAILLALGKFVGDVFHPLAVLAVFLLSGIVGAAVYGATLNQNIALFGVYPPDYGLIGAFTYLQWLRLGQMGQNQLRAFQMIAFLMAIQLLFALLFGGSPTWIADITGFVTGLLLSTLLAPGGWTAFMRRMRSR
jgi:rhomboid protease GluP